MTTDWAKANRTVRDILCHRRDVDCMSCYGLPCNAVLDSIDCLADAARQFIGLMGDSTVFAFYGDMGAGKTTFINALSRELGVEDDPTSSPSFAIINEAVILYIYIAMANIARPSTIYNKRAKGRRSA